MQCAAPGKAEPPAVFWALREKPCRVSAEGTGHRSIEKRLWEIQLQGDCTRTSWRRWNQALLSLALWEDKRWPYIETRGVQTGYRETLSPCEFSKRWDRLSGEVVQSPSLEFLQTSSSGQGHEQHGLASWFHPGGWTRALLGSLPAWMIFWSREKHSANETLWPPEPLALCSPHGHFNPFPLNVQVTPLL